MNPADSTKSPIEPETRLSRRQYAEALKEEYFQIQEAEEWETVRAHNVFTELIELAREDTQNLYGLEKYAHIAKMALHVEKSKRDGEANQNENLEELRRLVRESSASLKNPAKAMAELDRIISKTTTQVKAEWPGSAKSKVKNVNKEIVDDIILDLESHGGRSLHITPRPNSKAHSFGEAVQRFQDQITREAKVLWKTVGKEKARELLLQSLSLTRMSLELSKGHPLMDVLYPRHYENVGNYFSPKTVASFLTTVTIANADQNVDRWPAAHRLLATAIPQLVQKRMPTFFISPALLEAVMKTDFQDEINWQTLEIPFESGIFMLPLGSVSHPVDGELAFVIWNRAKKGDYMPNWPGVPRIGVTNDHFSIVGMCPREGVWYDSSLTAAVRPTLKLNNLFYLEKGETMPTLINKTTWDEETTGPDNEFIEKLGVLVFGTFLAMNARPDLLERGQLLKRVPAKREGEKHREFWSPNVIGRKYQMKRLPGPHAGTHASPRMHWRRGHFRNQPFGPALKERKTIWIEPCLVGAGEAK